MRELIRKLFAKPHIALAEIDPALERDLAILREHLDASFYLTAYPDVKGRDPYLHYAVYGWREGRNPTPNFDTVRYLAVYADVREAGMNPFVHYVLEGGSERPPLIPTEQLRDLDPVILDDLAVLRESLDADFYRRTYPDIEDAGHDPCFHYALYGWKEGRNPTEEFDTARYLEVYADVRDAGVNPFVHYIRHGKAENRQPKPHLTTSEIDPELAANIKLMEPHFDADYYIRSYADIQKGRVDPLMHFALYGWREGRNPSAEFNTSRYQTAYRDVRESGENPFVHYIRRGKEEGRQSFGVDVVTDLIVDRRTRIVDNSAIADLVDLPARPNRPQPKPYRPDAMTIHWVIPDFTAGAGGHMTIFRMIRHLETFGHRCTIWINRPQFHKDAASAYDDIVRHFQTIGAQVRFVADGFTRASGDAVFATGWDTVATVLNATGFREAFYFVQDYEPMFSPAGANAIAAALTYEQDLACICASPWLERLMRDRHGRWARGFHLAYEPATYNEDGVTRDLNVTPRIAVYARRHTERRAVDLVMAALQELSRRKIDFAVDFFGAHLNQSRAPFAARDHGVVSTDGLADLYRGADIGVCFSATNYSLVPQEMMACGLPVVEIDVESTRAIFPDDVVTFAGPHPLDIADKLEALLRDAPRRERQRQNARQWVSQFSWERSAREVESAILARLAEGGHAMAAPQAGAPARPKASVVIPTYNGMDVLPGVIDALRAQRAPWPFEIVCVDSSSTDGTNEWLKAQKDIVLRTIPQSEFQHGRTRNFGVSVARGAYVAFLTQDAKPANHRWLYDLVTVLEHFPKAAGAFGRHRPYPTHSPFTKRDIRGHFQGVDSLPVAVSKDTDRGKWESGDIGWRQRLHYYSDNNACLRRSVWKDIPYPEVDYGEDQVWADQIIRAGYEKVYVRSATVFHSHDYDEAENFKRCKIEGHFFAHHFGYKLMTSRPDLDRTLAALNARDTAFAKRNGVSAKVLAKQKVLNRAMLEGWLAGYQQWKAEQPKRPRRAGKARAGKPAARKGAAAADKRPTKADAKS